MTEYFTNLMVLYDYSIKLISGNSHCLLLSRRPLLRRMNSTSPTASPTLPDAQVDAIDLGVHTTVIAVYAVTWLLLLFPNLVPLARPTAAMLGGVIASGLHNLSTKLKGLPEDDTAIFGAIDMDTLTLLLGLMLVGHFVDMSGVSAFIQSGLRSRKSPVFALLKLSLLSAGLSAVLMNDTVCMIFAGPVVEMARADGLNPYPMLLALATSANIGSALTVTGNPQNNLIAEPSRGDFTFLHFTARMFLPTIVAFVINTTLLLVVYGRFLRAVDVVALAPSDGSVSPPEGPCSNALSHGLSATLLVDDAIPLLSTSTTSTRHRYEATTVDRTSARSISTAQALRTSGTEGVGLVRSCTRCATSCSAKTSQRPKLAKAMFFALTVCGVLLMMVLFALGLDADMVALSLGICLVALHGAMAARCDASTRRGEEEEPTNQGEDDGGNTFSRCGTKVDDTSTEVLAAMDYPLLLLFIGQFVLVAALVRTGLPSQLWEATIDTWCRTSPSGTASCATALSVLVLALANVISNVPFVLMVTPSLARPSGLAAAASAAAAAAGLVDATGGGNRERDWAVISFVATVAGNFLITGSAANLIVASGAERAGYRGFTTGRHALFGIPSTMLVIAAGVPILLETYNLW